MSRRVSPLAGFQVIIIGRFWVFTEGLSEKLLAGMIEDFILSLEGSYGRHLDHVQGRDVRIHAVGQLARQDH